MRKQELYKWIRVAGMLSFIPFVLIAGIFAGYFIAELLIKNFAFTQHAIPIFVTLGILISLIEVMRIVKLVIKIDKGNRL